MTTKPLRIAVAGLLLAAGLSPVLSAQRPSGISPVEPPERPTYTVDDARFTGIDVLRIAQDYVLGTGDRVDEVIVIMGNARLDGRALRDVTVIFGDVDLGPNAVVRSLSVVGGRTTVQAGARIEHDVLTVGGTFDAPPGFFAGGDHVIVGTSLFDGQLRAVQPWIMRGLLWGRPIVPGLPWVWGIVGLFFLLYLVVNAVFERPVRRVALTMSDRPLTSFVAGLIVIVLTGPVVFLLAVTLVGLLVVPIVICALFAALMLGKVGAMRSIGMTVFPEHESDGLGAATRSYVLGFAALTVVYMVPILGFATMAIVAVVGLGSSAIAFLAAYRRENPAPPRVPQTPPAAPPPSSFQSPLPAGGPMSLASEVTPPTDQAAEAAPPPAMPATAGASAVAVADLAVFPHAMFLDRLAAFVLDVFLVLISWQILWPVRRSFGPDGLFLALFTYHVGFWIWRGTTVGGIICQLRLVRIDGAPLQFVDAFVRGLAAIFSLAALGLGGLWILKDPDRQAWHDRIAGTFVVKVPRNYPI